MEPDARQLLEALARFLDAEVRPKIADPALAFRLRIASHLLETVGRELVLAGPAEAAALARLRALLEQDGDRATLDAALAARLASAELDDAARAAIHAHLVATLADELRINQPRFSLSPDPERETP